MSIVMRRRATRYSIGRRKSTLEKQTAKTQVEATCPICQELVGCRKPEGIIEGWSILPCGHRFGSYCIKHYLRVVADNRPSCPVCRQNVYHSCGHPVLPTVLTPQMPELADSIANASQMLLVQMQFSRCTYCVAPDVTSGDRKLRLPSALRWLRHFDLGALRRRGSRRNLEPGEVEERQTLVRERQDANPDEWHGPWIDPFPRARDLEWEKWWLAQEPRRA